MPLACLQTKISNGIFLYLGLASQTQLFFFEFNLLMRACQRHAPTGVSETAKPACAGFVH